MTSTLGLTRYHLSWTPKRATFDEVLEGVARHTKDINPEISDLFANSVSEYTGGMLFLDHWTNPKDFQIVLDAVIKYREDAVNNVEFQFTQDYFNCIDQLIDLLKQKIKELEKSKKE
jgi:hypothetical protein